MTSELSQAVYANCVDNLELWPVPKTRIASYRKLPIQNVDLFPVVSSRY